MLVYTNVNRESSNKLFTMLTIDQNTVIDNGLQLSKNFILEHVTSGAYHPLISQWIPKYSSKLNPRSSIRPLSGGSNIPLWQIVRNLQIGSTSILENLLNGFGGDLIIQSGFLNNVPKNAIQNEVQHLIGTSFDVQIRGYEDNMYGVAKEIQRLSGQASNLNLVFGATSWMHIGIDPKTALTPSTSAPTFSTTDILTGITETGLTSLIGYI